MPVQEKEAKGTAWLAEYVNDTLGVELDNYKIRIVLRKLAKDEVIVREEGRYTFSGPNDPTVKQVVKFVRSGGLEKANAEKLDELKAKRTKKATAPVEDEEEEEAPKPARSRSRTRKAAAAAETKPVRSRSRKAKPAPVEDEDEELDIDEI